MAQSFACFLTLFRRELLLVSKKLGSDLIDAFVVFGTGNVVFGYLFPGRGGFGPFMMLGSLSVYGLFKVTWEAMMMANDMEQNKLGPYFVMPISVRSALSVRPIVWALHGFIMMWAGLCIGKLLLWDVFPLNQINWLHLLLMMVSSQLLYGFFALWISSLVGGLIDSRWLYPRLINPMFMFSCQFYSWYSLYPDRYAVGLLHLINPVVYCIEGVRGACLEGTYLPVSLCLAVLWAFILFFFWDGTRRFKKKYDLL